MRPDPRPAPDGPRWSRTHSLRCRPPLPQLCLARLGLLISARPADLSASIAARAAAAAAAAAKTPSGKTFRRGRVAHGLRAPPLPRASSAPTSAGAGRGLARLRPRPRLARSLPQLPKAVQTKGAPEAASRKPSTPSLFLYLPKPLISHQVGG